MTGQMINFSRKRCALCLLSSIAVLWEAGGVSFTWYSVAPQEFSLTYNAVGMGYLNFYNLKSNSKPNVRVAKMHELIGTLIRWYGLAMGTPDPSFTGNFSAVRCRLRQSSSLRQPSEGLTLRTVYQSAVAVKELRPQEGALLLRLFP